MANLSGYTIAFDLDGTLVDTAPDIARALNYVLRGAGLPPAGLDEVRALVGHGSRAAIERATAARGLICSEAELDALTDAWMVEYERDIAGASTVNPGVVAALDRLAGAGANLSVCTNKRTRPSRRLLDAVDLAQYFGAVVGSDAVTNRKPHPDHFIAAIRAVEGDPARAMMVGDSVSDVGAGKAAGAAVVVYAHGYTDTAPELLGADAVFGHFSELPDLVVRILVPQPTPRT